MAKQMGQRYAALTFGLSLMNVGATKTTMVARMTNFRVPKIHVFDPSVLVEEHDMGGWIKVVGQRRRRSVPSPVSSPVNRGSHFQITYVRH